MANLAIKLVQISKCFPGKVDPGSHDEGAGGITIKVGISSGPMACVLLGVVRRFFCVYGSLSLSLCLSPRARALFLCLFLFTCLSHLPPIFPSGLILSLYSKFYYFSLCLVRPRSIFFSFSLSLPPPSPKSLLTTNVHARVRTHTSLHTHIHIHTHTLSLSHTHPNTRTQNYGKSCCTPLGCGKFR